MGIEPTYPAWKAGVLPLNYTRISLFSRHACIRSLQRYWVYLITHSLSTGNFNFFKLFLFYIFFCYFVLFCQFWKSVLPIPDICFGYCTARFLDHQFRALGTDLGVCRNRFCNKCVTSNDRIFSHNRFSAKYRRIGIDCHIIPDRRMTFHIGQLLPLSCRKRPKSYSLI